MKFLRSVLFFFLNLLFHWRWSIPAWILLICHFAFGISIWWFVGAIILFVVCVELYALLIGGMIRLGNADEAPKQNKNPYSNGSSSNRLQNVNKKPYSSGNTDNRKDQK